MLQPCCVASWCWHIASLVTIDVQYDRTFRSSRTCQTSQAGVVIDIHCLAKHRQKVHVSLCRRFGLAISLIRAFRIQGIVQQGCPSIDSTVKTGPEQLQTCPAYVECCGQLREKKDQPRFAQHILSGIFSTESTPYTPSHSFLRQHSVF